MPNITRKQIWIGMKPHRIDRFRFVFSFIFRHRHHIHCCQSNAGGLTLSTRMNNLWKKGLFQGVTFHHVSQVLMYWRIASKFEPISTVSTSIIWLTVLDVADLAYVDTAYRIKTKTESFCSKHISFLAKLLPAVIVGPLSGYVEKCCFFLWILKIRAFFQMRKVFPTP